MNYIIQLSSTKNKVAYAYTYAKRGMEENRRRLVRLADCRGLKQILGRNILWAGKCSLGCSWTGFEGLT